MNGMYKGVGVKENEQPEAGCTFYTRTQAAVLCLHLVIKMNTIHSIG